MISLNSRTSLNEKASEAGDSDDEETSFSDASGTPPPRVRHRHQARADTVSEAFEKVSVFLPLLFCCFVLFFSEPMLL